jgi:predicted nucleic acid-binding protein
MADGLNLYYWDANLFYEHLKEEPVPPLMRQGVLDLLAENKEKRNRICTSTITHLEVLPRKLPADKEKEYWGSFNSMFFFDIPPDKNITALAREIKNFYYQESDQSSGSGYRMLSTCDAVHLATAITHGATAFHTRDKSSKHGNVKLLGLPEASPGGKICGVYDLRILSPIADQGKLEGI